MTSRLVRLHLDSRQVSRALFLLVSIAVVLRISQVWTSGTGLFAQLLLLLITLAAASVIAVSTQTPFGESENGHLMPALRTVHVGALFAVAAGTFLLIVTTADYGPGALDVLRNLAGFTGLTLLTAATIGARFAWTFPLGYVLVCGAELDLGVTGLWTWPTMPGGDGRAIAVALGLFFAGLVSIVFANPESALRARA